MVCRYFGKKVAPSQIREVVHTSTDGTSLAGITAGAAELGLAARAVRASKTPAGRAAAAGDRPLGGQPLGRPLRGRARPRPLRGPGARAPARPARRVPRALERVRGARLLHRAVRGRRRAAAQPRLALGVLPPPSPDTRDRRAAGARRGRAAAPAADHDAGRDRPGPARRRRRAALDRARRARRRPARDHRSHARPALPPRADVGAGRHRRARLPDREAARPPDDVLLDAAHRRHRAPARRAPSGAGVLRRERRAGADRRHADPRGRRAHVLLQLGARAGLPRDRAALRLAAPVLVAAAAADVREPRGGLRRVRLVPDRRDPRDRDGQGDVGRAAAAGLDAGAVPDARDPPLPDAVPRPHLPGRRAAARVRLARGVPRRRLGAGHQRNADGGRVRRVQLARRARERARPACCSCSGTSCRPPGS